MDHVRELRTRLFVVAAVFIIGSVVSYLYLDQIVHLLLAPLEGRKLIYLNPAGGFSFVFIVSIYAGIALAVPLLIQQAYSFVKPVLPEKVRHYSWRILLASLLLMIGGIVFGYLVAIPGALRFLYEFAGDYVQASLTADSYLSFIIAYTIGVGLVFQLPLLLLLIHWIKPFTPKGLLSSERWVIVLAFVAAAIITPTPDPLNQTIIALPIILVYQFGVITILFSLMKARRRNKSAKTLHAVTTPVIAPLPAAPSIALVKEDVAPVVLVAPTLPVAEVSINKPVFQRSIDGMTTTTRHARPTIHSVPKRPPTQLHQYTSRPLASRRATLSLDGLSRITPTQYST